MKKQFSFLILLVLALVSLNTLRPAPVAAAEGCGEMTPSVPSKVWAKSGPKSGQVTLYWDAAAHADHYAIAYGTTSAADQYGAGNVGNTTWFTVNYLQPGVTYYFKVAAKRGCATSGLSSPAVWAKAAGAAQQVSAPVGGPAPAKVVTAPKLKTPAPQATSEMLWAKSGPKIGEVTLYWKNVGGAENYHLVYGTQPGKYLYGALNIGKLTWFTVRHLVPGTRYYFALVPVVGGEAKYTTPAVSAWAMAPAVEVVQTTQDALMQPKPKAMTPLTDLQTTPGSVTSTPSAGY